MMETISEKLEMIRTTFTNKRKTAFANFIGLQGPNYSNMITRRGTPTIQTINNVLKTFEQVDANWFFREGFEMDMSKREQQIKLLKQELEHLKKEVKTLTSLTENQAKTIQLLEKNNKIHS